MKPWVSPGMGNSLYLVSQRTEGCECPEPDEAQQEDKDTRTPPPQILLPLEERATHFRDMLLERGVRKPERPPRLTTKRGFLFPGGSVVRLSDSRC
jgi:hypothetical protein